jgi:RimJ/RimL family protein N-acetyltransferase
MVDPERGWATRRLHVEPLRPAHAAEMFAVLDDPGLHEFTGGAPLPLPDLTRRYAALASRRSPDGGQVWCNWVLRERASGTAVGTVQATLPRSGPDAGEAEVAWVIGRAAQGRGYAREAAASLVERLHAAG